MPVRKTESRIPDGYVPSDFGEAIVANDGRCALVSFTTSPVVADRQNTYIAFLTDAAVASNVNTFEWTIAESGGACDTISTEFSEFAYSPQNVGDLYLTVRFLDGAGDELASLSITQKIDSPNDPVEILIAAAIDAPGAGIGSPEVARELVNDLSFYFQAISLPTEADDSFQSLVFGLVADGTSQSPPSNRGERLAQMAGALNTGAAEYGDIATGGFGVCGLRPTLLAMIPNTLGGGALLPWTELPENASDRALADLDLREKLAALPEEKRIDLFNLIRFPKSNITQCGRVVAELRDHYFAGAKFNDLITGFSGTRAFWLTRHYREGPLIRS
jgi:hypothetical protein